VSELTPTGTRDPGFGIRLLEPASVHRSSPHATAPSSTTHCECVQKRTTVCRIFSCQRTHWLWAVGTKPWALPVLSSRDRLTAFQRATCLNRSHLRLARPRGPAFALRATADNRRLACQPSLTRMIGKREQRLVENTGLEPVTSWLQTRRSPS
jgi:hypothetical protein